MITREDIIRLVNELDIKFIRLQFADVLGIPRMWLYRCSS